MGKFLDPVISPRPIRPLSRSRRSLIGDLSSRTGRARHGRFLLEGPRAIEDALRRGIRFEALIVTEAAADRVLEWAAAGRLDPSTRIERASEAALAELADTATPQGMLAVGPLPPLDLAALPGDPGPFLLLADGVQDPGNLGTLLRTLAGVGGRTALCARGTVDPYNPKALRGAAGATFALRVAAGMPPEAAAEWCAANGVALVALVAGAPSLFEAALPPGPLALAVGNEAAGLSAPIEERAQVVAGLPMAPAVESLSVAVAGSIALYGLAHGLRPAGRS